MTVDILILILLTLAALGTVMVNSLFFAAIGLALTSAILTIVMFRLNSPLAAVFELSVCAGLIAVIFISITTMTQPQSRQEVAQHTRDRLGRFKFLPPIIILAALGLVVLNLKPVTPLPFPEVGADVRDILWNQRPLDLIGQVLILLAGVFAVVIFFKEKSKDG